MASCTRPSGAMRSQPLSGDAVAHAPSSSAAAAEPAARRQHAPADDERAGDAEAAQEQRAALHPLDVHRRRRRLDRGAHARIGAAAAQVGDRGVDVGVARLGVGRQQRRRGHQHAALAVAALRHLVLDPGLLQRMRRRVRAERLRSCAPPCPAPRASGVTHERTARPSTCTVQAPHAATPQPNLVPVRFSSSRSSHSSGICGSASSSTGGR